MKLSLALVLLTAALAVQKTHGHTYFSAPLTNDATGLPAGELKFFTHMQIINYTLSLDAPLTATGARIVDAMGGDNTTVVTFLDAPDAPVGEASAVLPETAIDSKWGNSSALAYHAPMGHILAQVDAADGATLSGVLSVVPEEEAGGGGAVDMAEPSTPSSPAPEDAHAGMGHMDMGEATAAPVPAPAPGNGAASASAAGGLLGAAALCALLLA